jgi:AraC-like DNA-binding protein
MVFEGHTVVLPTASVLLIPPHMPHTERSDDTDWDTLWIAIRGKTLDKLSSQQPFHLADGQSLLPWAHQMLAWRQQQVGPIGPELDALAAFLLTAVLRLMQQSDPGNCPGWLSEVLAHIHQHLDQPIVMDDLADLASCSLGHFHQQFHQATGETPLHYLARHRMERALQFLRQTQWPVKTIAAKSGFTDPLYFSRCFRKVFGCSPVQARKRMQGQKHR